MNLASLRKLIKEELVRIDSERASLQEHGLLKSVIKSVLAEELTRADKKEIERLIQRAIEDDRSEQKKLIQKELEAELTRSLGKSFFRQPNQIRQIMIDVCQEELSKELQAGSDMEKSVVDVTKRVLSAWHELLYKQPYIINRIKL